MEGDDQQSTDEIPNDSEDFEALLPSSALNSLMISDSPRGSSSQALSPIRKQSCSGFLDQREGTESYHQDEEFDAQGDNSEQGLHIRSAVVVKSSEVSGH